MNHKTLEHTIENKVETSNISQSSVVNLKTLDENDKYNYVKELFTRIMVINSTFEILNIKKNDIYVLIIIIC